MLKKEKVDRLAAFLPKLKALDGVYKTHHGKVYLGEYNSVVDELIKEVSSQGWLTPSYHPEQEATRIKIKKYMERANAAQLRNMLTYIIQSERVCLGSIGGFLENGVLQYVIKRIQEENER